MSFIAAFTQAVKAPPAMQDPSVTKKNNSQFPPDLNQIVAYVISVSVRSHMLLLHCPLASTFLCIQLDGSISL